jgi:hypothetical protein
VSYASDNATVTLLLCDYAVIDPMINKPTILGAAQQILTAQPQHDPNLPDHVVTPPFSIYANITLPLPDPTLLVGESYVLSVDLRTPNDEIVNLPNSDNKLRFNQIVTPEVPHMDGTPFGLPSHHNITINFSNGLPLLPNVIYHWTLQIDGNIDQHHWTIPLLILPFNPDTPMNPNMHQPLIG